MHNGGTGKWHRRKFWNRYSDKQKPSMKQTLPDRWNFKYAVSDCRNLNKVIKNERTTFSNTLWNESRGYDLEGPGIKSRWEIFRTRPDRSCGPTNLLYSGYRASFPGVKRPGHGVDHPLPSSAEVKERVQLYLYSTSAPSRPVLGWTLSFSLSLHGNESTTQWRRRTHTVGRQRDRRGGHAAADQVPVCWSPDFNWTPLCTYIYTYTADHTYTPLPHEPEV
jgi:hypothetical protein